jgi:hypothetical protein
MSSDYRPCDLDKSDEWSLESVSEYHISNPDTDTEGGLSFNFCTYKRIKSAE